MNFKILIFCFLWTTVTAQNVTIKGYIHDRKRDEPLPFCNIIILELKYQATSDIDGNFKFKNVPPGTYKVKAVYIGYGDTTVEINIVNKTTFDLRLQLPPPCQYDKSLKNKTCPVCNKKDQSIPIVYGLMISTEDKEDNKAEECYPGGCQISKCDPNWYCKRDKCKF